MATTKRDLSRRIADATGQKQTVVRTVIQSFLDEIVDDLAKGNRIEFRDFGVFDSVHKEARVARNPRTGVRVQVPARTVVHFKVGRLMKERVSAASPASGSDGTNGRNGANGRDGTDGHVRAAPKV